MLVESGEMVLVERIAYIERLERLITTKLHISPDELGKSSFGRCIFVLCGMEIMSDDID